MEKLFDRARMLLAYMSEVETATFLMDTGVSPETAFLAVKAAGILNK